MVVRPKTFTTYLNRCPANCSFFVLDCFVRLPFSCFRFIFLTFFASQSLFCDSFCPWFRLTASCRRRHSDGDEPVSDDCQGTPTSLCIMTLERMAIARVRSTSAPPSVALQPLQHSSVRFFLVAPESTSPLRPPNSPMKRPLLVTRTMLCTIGPPP